MASSAPKQHETEEDAITEEEITGTAEPAARNTSSTANVLDGHEKTKIAVDESNPRQRKSAFTELMTSSSRKEKESKPPKLSKQSSQHWSGHGTPPMPKPGVPSQRFQARNTLGKYIANPEQFLASGNTNSKATVDNETQFGAVYDTSQVLHYDEHFVVLRDLYPKSQTHLLLLPRNLRHTLKHPFDAFEDRQFLKEVKAEAEKWKRCVGDEMRRQHKDVSMSEKARNEALAATLRGEEKRAATGGNHEEPSSQEKTLPDGRDWTSEVLVGMHAVPSMTHLHVHIMSPDRHSPCLRHRKHYNSFSTPFFVPLADFPLHPEDERRDPTGKGYLKWNFTCWRCSKDFGNGLVELKKHLEEEFEVWRNL
ncbi:MAG: aprataxin-like protein [Alyxoria varia]|nr:MAG: aprataxin-like protein [Alyxoria varia]